MTPKKLRHLLSLLALLVLSITAFASQAHAAEAPAHHRVAVQGSVTPNGPYVGFLRPYVADHHCAGNPYFYGPDVYMKSNGRTNCNTIEWDIPSS